MLLDVILAVLTAVSVYHCRAISSFGETASSIVVVVPVVVVVVCVCVCVCLHEFFNACMCANVNSKMVHVGYKIANQRGGDINFILTIRLSDWHKQSVSSTKLIACLHFLVQ